MDAREEPKGALPAPEDQRVQGPASEERAKGPASEEAAEQRDQRGRDTAEQAATGESGACASLQTTGEVPRTAGGETHAARVAQALRAFERGDFGTARREARELDREEVPEEVRRVAREILRRTGVDPVAILVAVGTALVFVGVVVWVYAH